EPYFNQPAYEGTRGRTTGTTQSVEYDDYYSRNNSSMVNR
ncbi:unnamed protein product, partial [Rotaria sp. Silwood2]